MRPHLLQDLGQSSNSPVPASLIKEQVYVYVYGRATQLASLMKEQVYVWERARNSLVFATLIKDGNVCVYVWRAAWRHCDSGNQAYLSLSHGRCPLFIEQCRRKLPGGLAPRVFDFK